MLTSVRHTVDPRLISGAGFDPRSTRFAEFLAAAAADRVSGIFLREQRPDPSPELVKSADITNGDCANLFRLARWNASRFSTLKHPLVGGEDVPAQHRFNLDGVTDIFVDFSALSVGVPFPIVKYRYERVRSWASHEPSSACSGRATTDAAVKVSPCRRASPLHTFQGGRGLDEFPGAARLWLPQLGRGRREVLGLVISLSDPHAVCPILPFPAANPRYPDELIEDYGDL